MKFSQMIEGLQILAKYEEKGLETYLNGADHDVIWASTAQTDEESTLTDARLLEEDATRLEELGWFIDDESESWAHFC